MRKVLICGMFVLAGVVAAPTIARELSVAQDNGRDGLSWHDGKAVLVLRSRDGKGIRVIAAEPDGILGLCKSDDILAIDGQSVDSIGGLLDKLHADMPVSASLLVIRNGSRQLVTVKVQDYLRFMPPKPLAPPPAPPASGW